MMDQPGVISVTREIRFDKLIVKFPPIGTHTVELMEFGVSFVKSLHPHHYSPCYARYKSDFIPHSVTEN